jgi:hypothetical protein
MPLGYRREMREPKSGRQMGVRIGSQASAVKPVLVGIAWALSASGLTAEAAAAKSAAESATRDYRAT